jgi:hypothetical protein
VVNSWLDDGKNVVVGGRFSAAENFPRFEIYFWRCSDRLGFSAPIGGGELAEAGYGGGDDLEGFVDLFCGGEAGEGEADAGAGSGWGEAHGGEDVGGFGSAGLAGGASAGGDALEVESDDEGFGFEVIEIEIAGVGDAGGVAAVDAALVDLGEDALFEAVP